MVYAYLNSEGGMEMLEDYYGRRVLVGRDEIVPAHVQTLPTITVQTREIICHRCGQRTPKLVAALPNNEYYCPHCINLERVSTLCKFYHVPEPNQFTISQPVLTWRGRLSPLQVAAAQRVTAGMVAHQRQLLWAVTGAGKTEMIFQGVAACLARGERLAIASPRVDVCLELYPRLQAAFTNTEMVLLNGRQSQPYRYAQLTVCTTHQLLRFYHAFDNLIIDEVDAFPYAANPVLFYASQQASKMQGGQLFLTATPGEYLLNEVRHRRLQVTYLPLRYHGHLLPEIRCHLARHWRRQVQRGRLPTEMWRRLQTSLHQGHRFLLFVPHVADLTTVARACTRYFPATSFTTVHAQDPQRLEKVQGMRDRRYSFLITTSILERGVTFPEIDVFVLGADDDIFSSAALVQIAGRAGRSASRPGGHVDFWLTARCRRVSQAMRQIRYMNQKGRCCQRELSAM